MIIAKAWVSVCCGVPESITFIEKLNVPLVPGVPVIAQFAGFRLKPLGKLPALIENV